MCSHFTVVSAAAELAQSRHAAAASPSFPSSLIPSSQPVFILWLQPCLQFLRCATKFLIYGPHAGNRQGLRENWAAHRTACKQVDRCPCPPAFSEPDSGAGDRGVA